MHSHLLVSGLPRSLPPLPPSRAPPCLPFVEGRQRAAPQSSSFPLTTAPLLTLHMDVWGPARVSGQGREHYFLVIVENYTRYTTIFPLRSKGEVVDVLISWIRAVRLQLRERFRQDLPGLRLHSDRGASPRQNGIAEHHIGLVMEVARTSMIYVAAPHFLWPFSVQYVAPLLNLWPRVSLPETSPTLRWTGKVGDASVFRVWGSRAFVCDTSADKLSARAIPCVFLGFVPDAPGWQFNHPTSRREFPSMDVPFDELVPFYRLFPYRSAPPPPPPPFLSPGPPSVDPLPPQGPAPSGVSQVDPLPGTMLVEVAGDSGAAQGTASGGAEPGGAESQGAGFEGVEPRGAESGGAEPQSGATSGGPASARAGATGDTGAGGAIVTDAAGGNGGTAAAGPGDPTKPGAVGAGGTGARGTGAGGAGVGGAGAGGTGASGSGAGGAGAVDPGAGGAGGTGAGGTVRPRPYFIPLLQQVLGVPSSTSLTPPLLCPLPDQTLPPLQPASPLPSPSPYTEMSGGLTKRREPVSCPVSPVCTARHVPRSRPPPVPGTHAMALRPSSVPLRIPLPAPLESSLHAISDPECDRAQTTLAALGFAPSTADLSLFLRTDTSLPPFYVFVYFDDLVFATADIEALTLVKSELQNRHTCTDLGEQRIYLGLQITRDRARHTITLTQSHMVN
ncbi:unnamed protein product [Closterium sp. NIES-54]